jgi:hypothetical protein
VLRNLCKRGTLTAKTFPARKLLRQDDTGPGKVGKGEKTKSAGISTGQFQETEDKKSTKQTNKQATPFARPSPVEEKRARSTGVNF